MKKDLLTAIGAAIVGILVAYFVTANMILKPVKPYTVKSLSSTISSELDQPSVEIFNYRALNPTVEAYIDCSNYDSTGDCLDTTTNTTTDNPAEE